MIVPGQILVPYLVFLFQNVLIDDSASGCRMEYKGKTINQNQHHISKFNYKSQE